MPSLFRGAPTFVLAFLASFGLSSTAAAQIRSTTPAALRASASLFQPPALPAWWSPVQQAETSISLNLTGPLLEHRSWWERHPVWSGTLVGSVLGLGAYYLSTRKNPYCRDPDMFPCELAAPIVVVSGAAVGGLVGYMISRDAS